MKPMPGVDPHAYDSEVAVRLICWFPPDIGTDFETAHPQSCPRVRCEDLDTGPGGQASKIFDHLGIEAPSPWRRPLPRRPGPASGPRKPPRPSAGKPAATTAGQGHWPAYPAGLSPALVQRLAGFATRPSSYDMAGEVTGGPAGAPESGTPA
jgi:hypothetical protein